MPRNPKNPRCPSCEIEKDTTLDDGFPARVDVEIPGMVLAQRRGKSVTSERKDLVRGLVCRNCGNLELSVATPKAFLP